MLRNLIRSAQKTIQKKWSETGEQLNPGGKAYTYVERGGNRWDPGKGWLGRATSQIYGGSFRDFIHVIQNKNNDYKAIDTPPPVLSAEDMAARAKSDDVQVKRKKDRGRLAAFRTEGKRPTLLT